MGCLKKIIGYFIFFAFVYAFITLGGYDFVKTKYSQYTSPERDVLISEEKDFGNLENVSGDYIFSRSLNFFGYRKLNVYYFPKKQKITILDLNRDDILTQKDFEDNTLEEKLEEFSSKLINSPIIPIDNITILDKGKIHAKNKEIDYADFEADIKYIPFLKACGTIALYKTKNRENILSKFKKEEETPKLLISTKFPSGYDVSVTKKFISELGF